MVDKINVIDEFSLEIIKERKEIHRKEDLISQKASLQTRIAELDALLSNFDK